MDLVPAQHLVQLRHIQILTRQMPMKELSISLGYNQYWNVGQRVL